MKLPTTFADQDLCDELARHPALTLLLDLDGTLVPFAATPEAAVLESSTLEMLARVQATGVRIVIVSGRPRELVEPMRAMLEGVWWIFLDRLATTRVAC